MSTARRHHHVAALHLRGFATRVGSKKRRKYVLNMFDLNTGQWRKDVSVRDVAVTQDFYRVDVPGVAPDHVEIEVLSKIEDHVAPILARVRKGDYALSAAEMADLVSFA